MKKIEKEEELKIIKDFLLGMNTVQLGNKYNRNNTTIGRLLKRDGYTARNKTTLLTKEQVFQAYDKYLNNATTEELGLEYNVNAVTISNSFKRYGLKLRNRGHIPQPFNDSFFDVIDTEEKAYFLGFIMCDGSIVRDKNNYSLSIEISTQDKYLLEIFANLLEYKINKVYDYERIKNGKILRTSKITIVSKKICEKLMSYGVIMNKTGKKSIPTGIPKHLMRHALRGMFDADGYISTIRNEVRLTGGGPMVVQVADFFNHNFSLTKNYQAKHYKNSVPIISFTNKYDVRIIKDFLYSDCNIYLIRKNPFKNHLSPYRE